MWRFLAPGPRTQHVLVLRNGPLRGRCYHLTGIYLLFICPTCLVIALEPRSTQALSLLALSGCRLCGLSELRYGPWGVALLLLHLLHLLLVLAAGEENSAVCRQHKHISCCCCCCCCCLVLAPAAFVCCGCRCCLAFLVVLLWLLPLMCPPRLCFFLKGILC